MIRFFSFALLTIALAFSGATGASAQKKASCAKRTGAAAAARCYESGFVKIALREGLVRVVVTDTADRVAVAFGIKRHRAKVAKRNIEGQRAVVVSGSLKSKAGVLGVVTITVPPNTRVQFAADPAGVLQTSVTDSALSDPMPGAVTNYSSLRMDMNAKFTRLGAGTMAKHGGRGEKLARR